MGTYDDVAHVGQVILRRRAALRESVDEAGEKMGVSGATVSRWEQGRHEPTKVANLEAIWAYCGVRSDEDRALLLLRTRLFYGLRELENNNG